MKYIFAFVLLLTASIEARAATRCYKDKAGNFVCNDGQTVVRCNKDKAGNFWCQ